MIYLVTYITWKTSPCANQKNAYCFAQEPKAYSIEQTDHLRTVKHTQNPISGSGEHPFPSILNLFIHPYEEERERA